MRLYEFEGIPSQQKLLALAQLLQGRATDTGAKKEISTDAFISLARNLGVQLNSETLGELIANPPLSYVLLPFEPNSGVIKFKGNEDPAPTEMPVDQAEEIVSANAKRAMKS